MQQKSIYKYASEAGIPIGLYLTAMSACLLFSIRIPILQSMLMPLTLGFPIVLWFILRNIVRKEPAYSKFSTIWLGGIYSVIFGTLICLLLSGLYVVFIEPGFVGLYFQNAISTIEQSPVAIEYADAISLMKEAMDANMLPSGMEFLSSMAWFTCFMGSILSLFIALIMGRNRKKSTSQFGITR